MEQDSTVSSFKELNDEQKKSVLEKITLECKKPESYSLKRVIENMGFTFEDFWDDCADIDEDLWDDWVDDDLIKSLDDLKELCLNNAWIELSDRVAMEYMNFCEEHDIDDENRELYEMIF